ncbi:DUF2937 family protein [uncultured Tateyamaria sp.]|uniref:DUF2937 family protein n=1 Tax=uncultured Tateyamaria sp. TaxID=455651 RepID=UPI0026082BFA|nr:DUF2937 family protein [uncultured Tateyamaria sp.]
MIVRVVALAAGLLGGAAGSQFPEYAQQYTQRLGGAVDALGEVVADFDASAADAGLSRDAALAELQGSAFLEARRRDMTRTFQRYDRLREDLRMLERAGPFMRAYHAARMTDRDVARAAMATFEPAVPLTLPGVIFAGTGFLAGMIAVWAVLRTLLWPITRRRAVAPGA